MSEYDFDPYPEGDNFEGDVAWTEGDWLAYLHQNARDVEEFIKAYRQVKAQMKTIDDAAVLMGWLEQKDLEPGGEYVAPEDVLDFSGIVFEEEEAFDDQVYTYHKHPVAMISVGLLKYLEGCFEKVLVGHPGDVSAIQSWKMARGVAKAREAALQGCMNADSGDTLLGVGHLKYAVASVNEVMSEVAKVELTDKNLEGIFKREAREMLFDLREIWLRYMRDCRREAERGPGGDFE